MSYHLGWKFHQRGAQSAVTGIPKQEELTALVAAAQKARRFAYAPYSRFAVGAAILADSGQVFSGANLENASFGAGMCAERTAAAHALMEGVRDWQAIAIALPGGGTPCGICRQFLAEFKDDLLILSVDSNDASPQPRSFQLAKLLPHAFTGRDVAQGDHPHPSDGS